MLKNYFLTAFRNIRRNKLFSAINILGLSIGISAALVIFLIVYHEFSYDKIEQDKNRIYRVVIDAKFNGTDGYSAGVQAPLADAVRTEITGVETTVPVMQFQGDATAKVSIANKQTDKPTVFKNHAKIVFTNADYFSLLPYTWIVGDARLSLNNPFSVVLTESRARQYFATVPLADMIGRRINYNDDIDVTVSGIVKDLDAMSSFAAAEFISYPTIAQTHLQENFMMNVWSDWMAYSQLYVKLISPGDAPRVETQLNTLLRKYNKNAVKDANNLIGLRLQPLSDVHFNERYPGVGQRIAHMPTLYSLLAVAAFLLLLGCINFINLTTANASHRAKEIGIRKTMGGSRRQIMLQFLGETFLITLIAAVISLLVAPYLLHVFHDFTPPELTWNLPHQQGVILFLALLVIVVSFISGLYPALILSGFKPALILKSKDFSNSSDTKHIWIRKSLTVSQFVIAQFFIIATIMVSKQINYSLNTDLGFNKDGIITFDIPRDTVAAHTQQLLNAINAIPEVEVASAGFLSPADEGVAFTNVSYAPKKDLEAQVQFRWGTPEYLNVYKLRLAAGRNVAPSDTMKEFLINETYAKMLGFQKPEDALGQSLDFNGKQMPIVGVMHDFHDQSTRSNIFPLIFADGTGSTYHVRFRPSMGDGTTWKNGIHKIEQAYKNLYPEADFDYHFYDETIAQFYKSEQQTAGLLSWAMGLSIFISCLGLLGLVLFTINSRTKEIGIRKVLGASVISILTLLSRDFIKLVCLACVIAIPLAWWACYKWTENFAYRTTLSWWVFAIAAVSMVLVTLITLSIQTIKAALANPVNSLRSE